MGKGGGRELSPGNAVGEDAFQRRDLDATSINPHLGRPAIESRAQSRVNTAICDSVVYICEAVLKDQGANGALRRRSVQIMATGSGPRLGLATHKS